MRNWVSKTQRRDKSQLENASQNAKRAWICETTWLSLLFAYAAQLLLSTFINCRWCRIYAGRQKFKLTLGKPTEKLRHVAVPEAVVSLRSPQHSQTTVCERRRRKMVGLIYQWRVSDLGCCAKRFLRQPLLNLTSARNVIYIFLSGVLRLVG